MRETEAAVGTNLLAYLFACRPGELEGLSTALDLRPGQAAVERVMARIVEVRLPQELDETNRPHVMRALLMEPDATGAPMARHLHEQAGGDPPTPLGDDRIEAALAHLAVDSYPAFLLPVEEQFSIPMLDEVNRHATSLLFRHPQSERFADAVLQDPRLSQVFSERNEHSRPTALVYRNTGQGGGLQLATLPELVLRSAWRNLPDAERSPQSFTTSVFIIWRLVRDVLHGETRAIGARFSFTGILLPPGTRLELNDGVLRETNAADRRIAPESLKHQLTGTDASGSSTLINYDGDVVFEAEVPYKVEVLPPTAPEAAPAEWPRHLRMPASLERSLTRLRASLLLSAQREHRVHIVPAWRYFDDPLNWGYALSWFDPRNATGLMPTTLTEAEVAEWEKWYRLLDSPHVERIEVALSRVLRAVGERKEPSDVLIDSVIAWENLFGTSEGEPTLRVTASLALLLEDEARKRQELRTVLARIYALRSKVVHGNHVLRDTDFPLCYDALEVAIKALRTLIERRSDILELPDGGARSLRLILDG